jgi:hypothetical protein
MVQGKHPRTRTIRGRQITNKLPCLPAPVPTEGGAGRNDQNFNPLIPSLSPKGRRKWKSIVLVIRLLEFGYYLGFGIWSLEIYLVPTSLIRSAIQSIFL